MKINEKDLYHNNDMLPKFKAVLNGKRVAVFIDAANVYFGAQKKGIYLSYETIAQWFMQNCPGVILNFYTAFNPDDEKQEDFLAEIESFGYNIIKKPVKIFADTNRKGNMDIELCVDAMRQKDEYDIIVLMSGDGDFQYLFQALKSYHKKTLVLGVGGFTSFDLHNEADYFFFMNRVKNVWQAKRKGEKQYFIYLDDVSNVDYGEDIKDTPEKDKKNIKVNVGTSKSILKGIPRQTAKNLLSGEAKNQQNLNIRQKISAIFDSTETVKEKLEKLKKLKSRRGKSEVKQDELVKKPAAQDEQFSKMKDFMEALPYDKAETINKPLQRKVENKKDNLSSSSGILDATADSCALDKDYEDGLGRTAYAINEIKNVRNFDRQKTANTKKVFKKNAIKTEVDSHQTDGLKMNTDLKKNSATTALNSKKVLTEGVKSKGAVKKSVQKSVKLETNNIEKTNTLDKTNDSDIFIYL